MAAPISFVSPHFFLRSLQLFDLPLDRRGDANVCTGKHCAGELSFFIHVPHKERGRGFHASFICWTALSPNISHAHGHACPELRRVYTHPEFAQVFGERDIGEIRPDIHVEYLAMDIESTS